MTWASGLFRHDLGDGHIACGSKKHRGRNDQAMKKFKLYFDKEKEETWLNEMCGKGLAMTKFFLGVYTFAPCEPGAYIYQIDTPPASSSKISPAWVYSSPSSSRRTGTMEPSPERPLKATSRAMVFSPCFRLVSSTVS